MAPRKPCSPRPCAAQSKLIDDLGGPKAVADVVSARKGLIDDPLTPQAISNWRRRGIPFEYRATLAIVAGERGIGVPAGFLGEGVQPTQGAA